MDRFPRNKLTAVGLWSTMSCLIVEAALVANFVPSTNENALRAAVAMLFVFQIGDTIMLNGKQREASRDKYRETNRARS